MTLPILHLGTLSGGTACGIPGRIASGTVAAVITCPACKRQARGGTYAQCSDRLRGVEYFRKEKRNEN